MLVSQPLYSVSRLWKSASPVLLKNQYARGIGSNMSPYRGPYMSPSIGLNEGRRTLFRPRHMSSKSQIASVSAPAGGSSSASGSSPQDSFIFSSNMNLVGGGIKTSKALKLASKALSCQPPEESTGNMSVVDPTVRKDTDRTVNNGLSSQMTVKQEELKISTIPFKVSPKQASASQVAGSFSGSQPKPLTQKAIIDSYIALSKPRLTALVVLSTMSAYALAPSETSLVHLFWLTLGTMLCSSSANSINMAREYIYDGMMTRTRSRPVVRGIVSPRNAFIFAAVTGLLGTAALYFGVNPTVAALGAANIVLYGGVYTSLKRISISNTWVGAIVGGIPPLMGWAASNSLTDPGAWTLAALLYCWQFPHFMALSHNIRAEYQRAGYVMAAWTNPALNARVALRHSIVMFPICIAMAYFNVTDWLFVFDSGILNGWLAYVAWKFWLKHRYDTKPLALTASAPPCPYARKLFWGSVIHLPGVLVLAMIHKKGHWDSIKARVSGVRAFEP